MKRKITVVLMCFALMLSYACNASTVQAYINLAVQIALQVAGLAGLNPTVANTVSGDLAKAEKLWGDFQKADQAAKPGLYNQVDATLTQAETDLNEIFDLGHVKDAKLQGVIRAALAIGVTAIESARTIMLGKTGTNPVTAAARVTLPGSVVKGKMTPAQLKALYNLTVSDYPQAQLH